MRQRGNQEVTTGRESKSLRLFLLLMITAAALFTLFVRQSVEGSAPVKEDRYYLRVSGCDDGGRAYLDDNLMVDVGFDEDSNWLDITEDVARGKNEVRFEVINKTGAITYIFQVRKNETVIFEQACGKAKEVGCENNRAFRVGKARKFTYTIGRDE
ncbi:MAG TPA: hypothetical protein VJT09_04900 [Pyrinomonadaceae bacterium]|nr:hypothetical protein [Pyrinomonadaceae bacterium]